MKLKLTHHCNMVGAVGNNGDTIVVDDEELAAKLLRIKGAIRLDDDEVESAMAPAPTETAAVAHKPRRKKSTPVDAED